MSASSLTSMSRARDARTKAKLMRAIKIHGHPRRPGTATAFTTGIAERVPRDWPNARVSPAGKCKSSAASRFVQDHREITCNSQIVTIAFRGNNNLCGQHVEPSGATSTDDRFKSPFLCPISPRSLQDLSKPGNSEVLLANKVCTCNKDGH